MAEALDNDDGLLFMEYARFGDVAKFLNKAAAAALDGGQLPFPVPTVWRFFDCLVKGCISMDYPPREVPANIPNNVDDPGAPAPTAGANLPETIPPGGLDGNVPGHAGIVHFDLDPTNGKSHALFIVTSRMVCHMCTNKVFVYSVRCRL